MGNSASRVISRSGAPTEQNADSAATKEGKRDDHAPAPLPKPRATLKSHEYLRGQPGSADFAGADFVGLLKITVESAHMSSKGHYSVTMSLGLQSFVSKTSTRSAEPAFAMERNFAVMRNESNQLHFVVHKLKRSKLGVLTPSMRGVAHMDLLHYFTAAPQDNSEMVLQPASALHGSDLLHATSSHSIAGSSRAGSPKAAKRQQHVAYTLRVPIQSRERSAQAILAGPGGTTAGEAEQQQYIQVRLEAANVAQVEALFWRELVALVDWDQSGSLDKEEFMHLMQGVTDPADVSEADVHAIWQQACEANQGCTDLTPEMLASVLSEWRQRRGATILRRCPVSGATLSPTDHIGNAVYMLLQLDAGLGNSLQAGAFRTAAQANRSWVVKMSEWALEPLAGNVRGLKQGSYSLGLNTHRAAAHIVVYDRYSQALEEELISPLVILAMRNMYQSSFGALMKTAGLFRYLQKMSEERGRHMDSAASRHDIKRFLKLYEGQVHLDDIADDLESFSCFNEFFYRKLKEGARPITSPDDNTVVTSAADCRLMCFDSVSDSCKFWIKGRRFSVTGLLADEALAAEFAAEASLLIFRLAPQDYHRFHSPVAGTIRSIRSVPGKLYTVNPIAVNSPMVDVFTSNKRIVMVLDTAAFGTVAFVAIGATLVGSILLTVQEGDAVSKGQEIGYFAFGGSTCITVIRGGSLHIDTDLQRMGARSVETYVRMGDRIGVRSDSLRRVPSHHNIVPEAVESQACTLAETWKQSMSTKRMFAAAEAMASPRATGQLGAQGEAACKAGGAAAQATQLHSSAPASPWRTLRDADLWKDHAFLRMLEEDTESVESSSMNEADPV